MNINGVSWKKDEFGIYHHPHAPASIYWAQINDRAKKWFLHHPGDPNHGKPFGSIRQAARSFTRQPKMVRNLMTNEMVQEWDDTPYYMSVASETYWSS